MSAIEVPWEEAPPLTDRDEPSPNGWLRPSASVGPTPLPEPRESRESPYTDIGALLDSGIKVMPADTLERSDGQMLGYRRSVNGMASEPEGGKTTAFCINAIQEMRAGHCVMLLDYEDVAERLLERLLALGADPEELRERFLYVRLEGAPSDELLKQLCADIPRRDVGIIGIDAVAGALSAEGLDEGSNSDVERWNARVVKPLALAGNAAVWLLDHETKDPNTRGRYARGAGHKLALITGVQYKLHGRVPFSRQQAGFTDFVVTKDRPAHIGPRGTTVARMHISPVDGGREMAYRLDPPPTSAAASPEGRAITEKLLDEIENAVGRLQDDGPVNRSKIAARLRADGRQFSNSDLTPALMQLTDRDRLSEQRSGNSSIYSVPDDQEPKS